MQSRATEMGHARPLPATAPSVFHPSDFSDASEIAFAHALKIALVSGATLHMLHVSDQSRVPWVYLPGVRDTLERWGLIPADSPRRAVARLGIEVRKVVRHDSDPVKASLGFRPRHPADVVVLAVHQRQGRMRWFQKSVGKPIVNGPATATLFVPHGVEGFVSRATGAVSLRNVLIPLAHKPSPQPALDATARFVRSLQVAAGIVTLLHVGAGEPPAVCCPDVPGWTWRRMTAVGDPAERILWAAGDLRRRPDCDDYRRAGGGFSTACAARPRRAYEQDHLPGGESPARGTTRNLMKRTRLMALRLLSVLA